MNTTTEVAGQSVPAGQMRSVTAIIVYAFTVTALTTIGARHLAALRRQPARVAWYHILSTLALPMFPLADLCICLYRSNSIRKRETYPDDHSWRRHACAAVDMRAIPENGEDADSIPLHLMPPRAVYPVGKSYDAKWFLRLLLVGALLLQSASCVLLWVRRAQHHARTLLDDYIAVNSVAGVVIAINSLTILLFNVEWRLLNGDKYVTKFQRYCHEPSGWYWLVEWMQAQPPIEVQTSTVLCMILQSLAVFSLEYSSTYGGFYENDPFCVTPRFDWENKGGWKSFTQFLGMFVEIKKLASCHPIKPTVFHTSPLSLLQNLADGGYFVISTCQFAILIAVAQIILSALVKKTKPSWPSSKRSFMAVWRAPMAHCGILYLLFSWGLCALIAWDLSDYRDWEQWMWKDPWTEKVWMI